MRHGFTSRREAMGLGDPVSDSSADENEISDNDRDTRTSSEAQTAVTGLQNT